MQRIRESLRIKLPIVDLSELEPEKREAAVLDSAVCEGQIPFDLTADPLLRTFLIRLRDEEHVFVVTIHHIITDGWSTGIFVRELAALYEAGTRDGSR